jgi:hypothetical protein
MVEVYFFISKESIAELCHVKSNHGGTRRLTPGRVGFFVYG